jgi:nitric oxide reductase NorD protein
MRRRWWLKARYRFGDWHGRLRARRARAVSLESVHRRLELFLTAFYGRPISVAALDDKHPGLVSRAFARRGFLVARPTATYAGESVLLPSQLDRRADVPVLTRYRLLALEQAERMVRGTGAVPLPADALERDLFFLREGATIDARIARTHRAMAELLERERREAGSVRPALERMSQVERAVELQMRELLATPPAAVDELSPSPGASLEWARERAREIRGASAEGAPYRGLPLASFWGETRAATAAREEMREDEYDTRRTRSRRKESRDESAPPDSSVRTATSARDQQVSETPDRRQEDPRQEPTADPRGSTASAKADDIQSAPTDGLPPAIFYDEWSAERGAYQRRAVAVRVHEAPIGDGTWARAAATQYASTVRSIRHQFERLRARRSFLRRQRSGAELDIDALVDAAVDRRAGRAPDDRLYVDVRPARRGIAIALVIDASGSTEQQLSESERVVDVERVALFLAAEALDALGDLYAIYSFGGQGATNVKISEIKSFAERMNPVVLERIGAIEPEGFTRLGAVIRHVTAQLARQSAGHRLLLLLSDGRPHDIEYQDRYAIEDTRQAVFEARASGVFPYCLTVDAEAAEYLPRLFGEAGHTVLRRPEQLPKALISVVNALLGG